MLFRSFRSALSIPQSAMWAAQREISDFAKASLSAPANRDRTAKMAAARQALVQGYRTQMLAQTPSPPR